MIVELWDMWQERPDPSRMDDQTPHRAQWDVDIMRLGHAEVMERDGAAHYRWMGLEVDRRRE